MVATARACGPPAAAGGRCYTGDSPQQQLPRHLPASSSKRRAGSGAAAVTRVGWPTLITEYDSASGLWFQRF